MIAISPFPFTAYDHGNAITYIISVDRNEDIWKSRYLNTDGDVGFLHQQFPLHVNRDRIVFANLNNQGFTFNDTGRFE